MGYVKRKATTKTNTKLPQGVFLRQKASFLRETVSIVKIHNIPPELIINLDETGLQLVPVGDWTMTPEGSETVEIAGLGDKRQITATFAGSLYLGKTDLCHAKHTFPDGIHVHHTPNHWANEETVRLFYERMLVPYVARICQEQKCPDQKALLIMDNFAAHSSGGVMQPLEENGVLLVFLPPTPLIDSSHSTSAQTSQPRTFLGTDSDTGMQSRFPWVSRVHQNVKLYQWTCELQS